MSKETVPVFFACDDNFVKYTMVAITSLKANASRDRQYDIHILLIKISDVMKKKCLALADDTFRISFDDVTDYMKSISYKMPIRDYYSKTTYYRLFIAEMFPQYDKAIYIDSDLVVNGDISELYDIDITGCYVGATFEQVMRVDIFAEYSEKALGISREDYFNAGVLLINCEMWRNEKVLDQFIKLLHEFTFVVAQDQDYLNVIFKDKYKKISKIWNCETFQPSVAMEDAKIIHYIFSEKPWHYKDCTYSSEFWKWARQTSVIDLIEKDLAEYPEEKKEADRNFYENFVKFTRAEIDRPDTYVKRQLKLKETRKNKAEPWKIPNGTPQAKERLDVIDRIKTYEREGKWDKDAEIDVPAKPILPGTVDFKRTKFLSKTKAFFSFLSARRFVDVMKSQKQLVIKDIVGLENLEGIEGGAVITCNHFSPFESFAVQEVFDKLHKMKEHKKSRLFRVITEANYTTYPGFYGKLMRNCNTLPLSTNHKVMNEFMHSTIELLQEGNFVIIYPEQSLWWNYRKPKPIKRGAFTIALKAKVPVIPCFITMKDTDVVDGDGFFVQEYTIHIGKPIYAPKEGNRIEASEEMMKDNYTAWTEIYEKTYEIPLVY